MTVRFLADEDVRADIIQGCVLRTRGRHPGREERRLERKQDPVLLELAAEQDRILITHDRNTMTGHFYERVAAGKSGPGLFIVPKWPSTVGQVIESLLLVWAASQAQEWRNQIVYLPFR